MALGVTSYVDPGVFVRERIQPSAVSITSDRVLGIVGLAPRTVRTTDEAVVRGKIKDESLTFTGSSPYTVDLTSTSNRNRTNAVLYKNGQALPNAAWSFSQAQITGSVVSTIDCTTKNSITISLDGKAPVTLTLTAATGASETLSTLVGEFNTKIVASSTYGADYSSTFSVSGSSNSLVISAPSTSVTTSINSDIKLFLTKGTTTDLTSAITGSACVPTDGTTASTGCQAGTTVVLADAFYSASATYTIEYNSVDSQTDFLVNANATTALSDIISAGSFPGGLNYLEDTDFEETGNTIDWDLVPTPPGTATQWSQASITCAAGTYAFTSAANNVLVMSVNGLINLIIGMGSSTITAAQAAVIVNNALVASAYYGPTYAHVATDVGGTLLLTAPLIFDNYPSDSLGGTYKGSASSITLGTATTCGVLLFGLATASPSAPVRYAGTGSRPSYGSVYYVSYDSVRSSTDYNTPTRAYTPSQVYDYTSPITLTNYTNNSLAVASEIAFENGASSLYLIQIDDSIAEGYPTQNEINAALTGAGLSSVITDVVVVDAVSGSELATDVALMNHVSLNSSMLERKYRRGWFGMPRDTAVGDPDTPDTFVYRSSSTLQPGNTSPGRGRLMLCAPSKASRTLTTEDGYEVTVELDGKYIAVANAALYCSLPSPSDAMLGRTITGFLTDSTFETYLQGERYTLADNGVNVCTLDAGNLRLLDPLTTEAGGSNVIQFAEPSSSGQKDALSRAIETVLDLNVKGIVPDDLSSFIIDIKTWVGLAIKSQINAGVIGPYRNADGTTRDLDFITDIQAFQDTTDPRTFTFKYFFMLKYVAKRFFGEYSVDNPFFTS